MHAVTTPCKDGGQPSPAQGFTSGDSWVCVSDTVNDYYKLAWKCGIISRIHVSFWNKSYLLLQSWTLLDTEHTRHCDTLCACYYASCKHTHLQWNTINTTELKKDLQSTSTMGNIECQGSWPTKWSYLLLNNLWAEWLHAACHTSFLLRAFASSSQCACWLAWYNEEDNVGYFGWPFFF